MNTHYTLLNENHYRLDSNAVMMATMLKNSVSEILLTDLICIRIHGEDAGAFLQSQLTIDVTRIESGKSRLGAYCEPKGRVISTLILAHINGDFYMLIPVVLKNEVLNALLKYRFRAKVEFDAATDKQVYGCYAGAGAFIPHPLDKSRTFNIRATLGTENPATDQQLVTWARADFNVGMVWLDLRTSCRHLPQSLGLIENHAVDFDKGCYPGQEIIARLKYLGQAKHTIQKFHLNLKGDTLVAADYLRDYSGKRLGQRLNSIKFDGKAYGLTVVSCAALATDTGLYFTDENTEQIGGNIVFDKQ